MTLILLDPRIDTILGALPIGATLTATPTRRRTDGSVVLYPGLLRFRYEPASRPIVDLQPPAAGWAWSLVLTPDQGLPEARTATFSGASVEWADLVDVDPATLDPSTPDALAGWDAVLAQVEAARDQILAASAPVLDAPDLTLVFENGLI